MGPRFRALDERRKCELAGDPHSLKRPYAKALSQAIYGRCAAIAERIHKSQRLVEAWGNPADPQKGPNQQLAEVIDAALAVGATEDEALAPVAHLAERYGRELAFVTPAEGASGAGIVGSASTAIREVNDAIATALDAVRDGRVTEFELVRVEEEIQQAITELHRLRREAQAAARAPKNGRPTASA